MFPISSDDLLFSTYILTLCPNGLIEVHVLSSFFWQSLLTPIPKVPNTRVTSMTSLNWSSITFDSKSCGSCHLLQVNLETKFGEEERRVGQIYILVARQSG